MVTVQAKDLIQLNFNKVLLIPQSFAQHGWKYPFFAKISFLKSPFSQKSHFKHIPFSQKSQLQNLLFFTKIAFSKSPFSQKSQYQNINFHKNHNFKISFFTKFTLFHIWTKSVIFPSVLLD